VLLQRVRRGVLWGQDGCPESCRDACRSADTACLLWIAVEVVCIVAEVLLARGRCCCELVGWLGVGRGTACTHADMCAAGRYCSNCSLVVLHSCNAGLTLCTAIYACMCAEKGGAASGFCTYVVTYTSAVHEHVSVLLYCIIIIIMLPIKP
jgi:hypothetical protein